MMRIGIDTCCWSNRRGFGRFTRELVGQMVALNQEDGRHDLTLVVDGQTAEEWPLPTGASVEVVKTSRQPTLAAGAESTRPVMDLWRLNRAVRGAKFDAFFFPAVYSFYPVPRRLPTVVTFHDAIAEKHPSLIFNNIRSRLAWTAKVRLALRQADRVLTVSQNAARQIHEVLGCPQDRLCVITEAPAEVFRPTDDVAAIGQALDRYDLPRDTPLILYVGGISPHKNLQGLVRAAAGLREKVSSPWRLVLIGDHERDSFLGCYDALRAMIEQLGMSDRVSFTGYVPTEDLVLLYNAAAMLVLPSFDEGFGLPVVEAMACELAVVASNRGSLPEVVGSAGLLFDPHDHEEMASTIGRVLSDAALRRRLAASGLASLSRFSWRESAAKVLALLEEVGRRGSKTA